MKIAIIGTGISGLGAAYLLHPHHEITVYEKNDTAGGHSRTIEAQVPEGSVPVDTGFIVFNRRNYPHLTGLFEHLNVPIAASDMSFSASIQNGWLEYGSVGLKSLFAQKRNLLRWEYLRMLRDILTFNREAKNYLQSPLTLGECLQEMGVGQWFRDYYLLAMGGAIWSTPLAQMLQFPAATFIRFFENHGLLTVNDQPQWFTVAGGSREYIKRLTADFSDRIRLNCGVVEVLRDAAGVTVCDMQGNREQFDKVVFASHPDQTIQMLSCPTSEEREVIGSFRYQPNRVVLHTDTSFMPRRRAAWASWAYLSDSANEAHLTERVSARSVGPGAATAPAISLSYWMNNLQPLATKTPIIVTLNPHREPEDVQNEHWFDHPVFDAAAIAAQQRIPTLQGQNHTYFAGAWLRYGFHEDGLLSAVNVAEKMGISPPWK